VAILLFVKLLLSHASGLAIHNLLVIPREDSILAASISSHEAQGNDRFSKGFSVDRALIRSLALFLPLLTVISVKMKFWHTPLVPDGSRTHH
jgi:hypothetical protein